MDGMARLFAEGALSPQSDDGQPKDQNDPNELNFTTLDHAISMANAAAGPSDPARYRVGTVEQGHKVDMTGPNRFELFLLGDGEEKVTQTVDTRVNNCITFHFAKEDHTLGNLLRATLLKNPNVIFAAYRVPHPLFPNFDLRVQTTDETTPGEAVVKASHDLIKDLTILRNNFTREWELRRMVDPRGE